MEKCGSHCRDNGRMHGEKGLIPFDPRCREWNIGWKEGRGGLEKEEMIQ